MPSQRPLIARDDRTAADSVASSSRSRHRRRSAVPIRLFAILLLAVVVPVPPGWADDDPPAPKRDDASKPAADADPVSLEAELEKDRAERKPPGKGGKPATDGASDDSGEMSTDEDDSDDTFGDPTGTIFDQLDRTVRRMRSAAREIAPSEKPTGNKSQSRALRDLDELIRQIEDALQSPPQGGGGGADEPPPEGESTDQDKSSQGASSQDQSTQGKSGGKSTGSNRPGGQKNGGTGSRGGKEQAGGSEGGKKKLKLRPQAKPGGTQIAHGGAGKSQQQPGAPQGPMPGQDNKEPGDSQAGTREGKAEKPEDPLKERVVKDVWGHLPPHLRDQLLNVYGEKYLPKYEDLVRRYYEVLAEQSRKGTDAAPRSNGSTLPRRR